MVPPVKLAVGRARVLETSLREAVGAGGARVLLHLQDLDGDERVRRETVIDERLLEEGSEASMADADTVDVTVATPRPGLYQRCCAIS